MAGTKYCELNLLSDDVKLHQPCVYMHVYICTRWISSGRSTYALYLIAPSPCIPTGMSGGRHCSIYALLAATATRNCKADCRRALTDMHGAVPLRLSPVLSLLYCTRCTSIPRAINPTGRQRDGPIHRSTTTRKKQGTHACVCC